MSQLLRLGKTMVKSGIALNPMGSHFGSDRPAGGFRNDCARGLDRHVAIDAVVRDFRADGFEHPATLCPMTGEAAYGVGRGRHLLSVYIVAGRTAHVWRGLVASAFLQQSDLVPMHVRLSISIARLRYHVVVQCLPGNKGECRRNLLLANPVMAEGT